MFCRAAARLITDDGQQFEVDRAAVRQGTTVEARGGRVERSRCGAAPYLNANLTAVPPRPVVVLTLTSAEWRTRAAELDALTRRFPATRFRLRVIGPDAGEAAERIAQVIAQNRPDLLSRVVIEDTDGTSGWSVTTGTRTSHAATADDVARLLAAAG